MRKGVMFSLIMIFLTLSLLTVIAIQRSLISHHREFIHVETRINSMNNMYESISRDIKKTTEIIGRRAVSISVGHIVLSGEGLYSATDVLKKLIFNETPVGFDDGEMLLMENATILYWMDKIEEVSILKGFYVNITILNFEIKPYDSWNLLANINLTINITDQQGIASLVRNITISELISIEDLEDPLYPLNTSGRVTNYILKTPYENYTELLVNGDGSNNNWKVGTSILIWGNDAGTAGSIPNPEEKILVTDNISKFNSGDVNNFMSLVSETDISSGITLSVYVVNATNVMNLIPNNTIILVDSDEGEVWNIENLTKHLSGESNKNSYYRSSAKGPSYLDRLEGKLTCIYCNQVEGVGLESLINKTYFSGYVGIDIEKTNIDYLYFNSTYFPPNICKVKGLHSWFRIDEEHPAIYNVTDLTYSCS